MPHTLPLLCRDLGKLSLPGCKLWIGGNLQSKLNVLFKWSLVIVQVMRTEVCLVDADVVYVLFFFIVTVHVMTCVDMINI